MKTLFYPRLAFIGMSKNKRVYIPYLLTCSAMVMMTYMVSYLKNISPSVLDGARGEAASYCLGMGQAVIAIFALIFLTYTMSFVLKRRATEFGLYNILGMVKRNIARILIWETVFTFAFSLIVGLLVGMIFSKLAELVMVNLLGAKANMTFTVDINAAAASVVIFAVIFFLLLLLSLVRVKMQKPIELLHSENIGEKPPKGNILITAVGIIFLAAGYAISLSVKTTLDALIYFFVAVICVIIGTYLLFISGSVTICRLLQKNKRFYYNTRHFVSVAFMRCRMKRNGAGLASICVLSTMVLVTVSAVVCMYAGINSSLSQIPRDASITYYFNDTKLINADTARDIRIAAENEASEISKLGDPLYYRFLRTTAVAEGDTLNFVAYTDGALTPDLRTVYFIGIEDFNRVSGENVTLDDDEILLSAYKSPFDYESVRLDVLGEKRVRHTDCDFAFFDSMEIVPTVFVVLPNDAELYMLYSSQSKVYGGSASGIGEYFGFNIDSADRAEQEKLISLATNAAADKLSALNTDYQLTYTTRYSEEDRYYALNGGLFFLGAVLGVVFGFSAVLIMYYKQLSEGYEDRSRFEIMQKVGMTRREIKKSISSQVLTVFFAPLAAAGVHIIFAYPIIKKTLDLFIRQYDRRLYILSAAACFALFSLLYTAAYFITSRVYAEIVNRKAG